MYNFLCFIDLLKKPSRNSGIQMVVWLFYNTVIPLLPVPLVLLGSWLIGANRNVLSLLRDGQLCFYCTALSAVAIRDVMLNSAQEALMLVNSPLFV